MTKSNTMQTSFFTCTDPFGTHRIAYTEWGQASDAPTILCAHGLTRNGRDFDRIAEALARQGRHVLCPTMVGRNPSDFLSAHPEGYVYAQYIADITALLAAKKATTVDWIGTSMGGLIGMMVAAAPESKIRRLVLNDIAPFIPMAALQRIAAYAGLMAEFADKAQAERYIRQIYAPFGITRDADWAHMADHAFRTLPNGKLVLGHDPLIAEAFKAVHEDVDLWPVYDAIKVPTLLLRGENSDVLPAETAVEMTQRGPKARLITYAGIGHAPALMDEAQIADVGGFLEV